MSSESNAYGANGDGIWLPFAPDFDGNNGFSRRFLDFAVFASKDSQHPDVPARKAFFDSLRDQQNDHIAAIGATPDSTPLQLAMSVLVDLLEQGWELKVDGKAAFVRQPQYGTDVRQVAKEKMKQALLRYRDDQLSEKANRDFVAQMETRHLGPHGWVSIFSLMRDGRDLAQALERVCEVKNATKKWTELKDKIRPYLAFVTEGAVCPHTGMRLMDIWRYFRHTWSTAYKSAPGRRMMFLIRDAAAPAHPVIGIGALASSVVQLTGRDKWIGWHPVEFVRALTARPTTRAATWILRSLRETIGDVHANDLVNEGTLSKGELAMPTARTVKRLFKYASREMAQHHRFPKAADIKSLQSGHNLEGVDWKKLAGSSLYKAKRARALCRLLQARLWLRESGLVRPTRKALSKAIQHTTAKRAIATILREVKAKSVGVCMMDISVCGAIAPYNILLGGKLISMLAASPEVIQEYRRRYSKMPSIIASSVKGKAIVRQPQLVLLGTTSLYATGSSQYNRIKVPAEAVGGSPGDEFTYIPLGETLGWGSFHFSSETLLLIENLVARSKDGRRVNSIFGEGVNPRLRKIRQGFDALKLPEGLLRHGNPRLVYMVPLAKNFRDVLLGRTRRPRYILPNAVPGEATKLLSEFWIKRWLSGRIDREGILESVRQHTLDYPITHGARVRLPEATELPEGSLFEELPCLPESRKL